MARRFPGGGARTIALLYLAAVACFWLLVRRVGDRWWATALLVYLPRHVLLVPALALMPVLWTRRKTFGLAYAGASGALILPFAGLSLALSSPELRPPTLRILSYNIWYDYGSQPAIQREIEADTQDIVLLQALSPRMEAFCDGYFKSGGWHTHTTSEFCLASRYPILRVAELPTADGRLRPPFIRYTLDTPLGAIDVFNVHLISPRSALAALRGSKRHLLSRSPGNPRAEIYASSRMRSDQARELADAVSRAEHPAIVAGDTNLPEQSPVFLDALGGLHDAFAEVGMGFGYTYPANLWFPWMRIDRILASNALEFANFSVGTGTGSDHYAVRVDVARRRTE